MHDVNLQCNQFPISAVGSDHDRKKVFLFLQGPNCGFFARIADQLESLGHRCLRVNLCFGDWLTWRRDGSHNFRGYYCNWKAYISLLMDREQVTDVILNGDQRLYHKAAILVAKSKGVRVAVTDFGYLRPDWITFEYEGTSGNSQFPKNRSEIRRLAESSERVDFKERYWDNTMKFAFLEARSGLLTWLFGFLYPGYRPFNYSHPISLGLGFCKTYLKKRVSHRATHSKIRQLINERFDNPFYFFAMQLETDFQIRAYSSYPNQSVPIEEVLISFAEKAPENTRLVFKIHPLDPDLLNWKRVLERLVMEVGISKRVFFLRDGPIADLLTNASGVLTINSSVGLKALQHSKKLKIMGQAVYDLPGLVFPNNLDEFWTSDFVPDASLFADVIQVLASMFQIRGGWFSHDALECAVSEAVDRLNHGTVNQLKSNPCSLSLD